MARWLIAAAVLLVAGYFLMPFFGFNQENADGQDERTRNLLSFFGSDQDIADDQEEQTTPFAADRVVGEVKPAAFDGRRAMDYLEKVCAIGPRMSGTPGMKKQQDLIRKHFEKLGDQVQDQTFSAKPGQPGPPRLR